MFPANKDPNLTGKQQGGGHRTGLGGSDMKPPDQDDTTELPPVRRHEFDPRITEAVIIYQGEEIRKKVHRLTGDNTGITIFRSKKRPDDTEVMVDGFMIAVTTDFKQVQVAFPRDTTLEAFASNEWFQKWISVEKITPRPLFVKRNEESK